jgi:outer membrane lipoprotein SlyB
MHDLLRVSGAKNVNISPAAALFAAQQTKKEIGMEAVQAKSKTHPLFIAAAGSLIVFSALGSAAIMGWLPRSGAEPAANVSTTPAASAPAAAVATAPAAAPAASPLAVKPAAAARVAAHAEAHPAHHAEHQATWHETAQPVATAPPAQTAETRRPDEGRIVLAQASDAAPPLPPRSLPPVCRECGVIESVNVIEKDGEGSGLGAVAGGVAGAVVGNQVGNGRGRTVMSVLGAVGGAFAGNQIEKKTHKIKSYDITVRFEDGTTRTVSQATPPAWRAGDRVRFVNGTIQPNA